MKDFDAGREARTPHPFKLGGETFLAKPTLSFVSLQRLMAMTEETAGTMVISEFFDLCLAKKDRPRMQELLSDDDRDDPVDIEQVEAVLDWLVKLYTGNRAGLSRDSLPGQPTTPVSSPDSLPLPDTQQGEGSVQRTVRL